MTHVNLLPIHVNATSLSWLGHWCHHTCLFPQTIITITYELCFRQNKHHWESFNELFETHCWPLLRWFNFTSFLLVNPRFTIFTWTLTKHNFCIRAHFTLVQVAPDSFYWALCSHIEFEIFWDYKFFRFSRSTWINMPIGTCDPYGAILHFYVGDSNEDSSNRPNAPPWMHFFDAHMRLFFYNAQKGRWGSYFNEFFFKRDCDA